MHPYCYLNGKILKTKDAHLPINDISILRGYASFDFLRIYNNKPFYFKDHFKRFKESSKSLNLKLSISEREVLDIFKKLIQKNSEKGTIKDFHIRLFLTGGETKEGILPSKPNFFILFEHLKDLPKEIFEKGAKIITFEHQRFLPESKTSNYMQAVMLQPLKIKEKAIEILYYSNNYISETTTSNIFMVKNGVLYTTKEGILDGITRKIVIDLAVKNKIKVIEKQISLKELFEADEVFLTATNKKVLPIVQIDKKIIKDKSNKKITQYLLGLYNDLIKA